MSLLENPLTTTKSNSGIVHLLCPNFYLMKMYPTSQRAGVPKPFGKRRYHQAIVSQNESCNGMPYAKVGQKG